MIQPSMPANEQQRLEKLFSYTILDTACELAFDDIVMLASMICEVPISAISLIDKDRQWFKAKVGLGATQTPRDISFCGHAIHQTDLMTVPDATSDIRFCDNPLVTGDPSIRFYAGSPLITPDGLHLGTLCVIDRTPRQLSASQNAALEALSRQVVNLLELRLKQSRLEQMNTQKNEFFAHVSHDLRSPIAALENLAELLQSEAAELDAAGVAEYARDLCQAASQTRELVDNLLDWARFDTDRIAFTPSSFQLSSLSEPVLNLLDLNAKAKKLSLRSDIPSPCPVFADPAMLRSLIHNLVVNAIKFSPEGGQVTLSAERLNNGRINISVRDQGCGLSEAKIAELLQPGQHRSSRGTAGETGSGLGISLCQRFAAAHGSLLDISSRPGSGSCFSFSVASI